MTGTLTSLGDYDQCLRIEVKDPDTTDWNKQRHSGGAGDEGSTIGSKEEVNEDEGEDDNLHGYSESGRVDEEDGRGEKINLMRNKREERSPVLRGQYCLLRARPVLPPPDPRTSLKDIVINVTGTVLEPTIYKDIAAVAHGFYSIPLQFALCIPSTCNPSEVEQVIQQLLEPLYFTAKLGPTCDVKEDGLVMDKAQMIALSIVTITIIVILFFSLLDALLSSCLRTESNIRKETNMLFTLCDSFSVVKNTKKLFNLETESEPKLHFIHGMRVLTMIWVIICHTYTFGTQFLTAIGSIRIEHEIRPLSRTLSMQFILNGWFSVETFFFLR